MIVLLLSILLTSTVTASHSPDELFLAGQFDQALAGYEQQAMHSATDLHRMGQCALQQNKPAQGIWYWRRAQKSAAFASYIQLAHLIAAAERAAGIDDQQHPLLFYLSTGICAVPLLLWQLLFLLLWGIFVWRVRRLYTTRRYGWALFLLGSIVLVGGLTWHCMQRRSARFVVALEPAVLYSGPSARYTQLRTVAPGSSLRVLRTRNSFYCVFDANGRGWINKEGAGLV